MSSADMIAFLAGTYLLAKSIFSGNFKGEDAAGSFVRDGASAGFCRALRERPSGGIGNSDDGCMGGGSTVEEGVSFDDDITGEGDEVAKGALVVSIYTIYNIKIEGKEEENKILARFF